MQASGIVGCGRAGQVVWEPFGQSPAKPIKHQPFTEAQRQSAPAIR